MVVVRVGIHSLVAGGAAPDVYSLDQLQPLQLVQGAIDAGTADRGDVGVDLECGQRALGAAEQVDDLPARVAAAVSRFVESVGCVGGPVQAGEAIRE